jgi:hypothetical protein
VDNLDQLPIESISRRIESDGQFLMLSNQHLTFNNRQRNQVIPLLEITKISSELGRLMVYSGERVVMGGDVGIFNVQELTQFFTEVRRTVSTVKSRQRAEQDYLELVTLKADKARSSKLSQSDLERYSEDEHYKVRSAVAQNPNLPNWMLERMSRDEHPKVRLVVAQHPETRPDTLEMLIADSDAETRAAAKGNLTVVLDNLSRHSDVARRLEVARNVHTPSSVLGRLSEDINEDVREEALAHASHPSFAERNHLPLDQEEESTPDPSSSVNVTPSASTKATPPASQNSKMKNDFTDTEKLAREIAYEYEIAVENGLGVQFYSAPDGLALIATLSLDFDFPRTLLLRASCEGADRIYPDEEVLELNPGGSAFLVFMPNGKPSNWMLQLFEMSPLRKIRLAPSGPIS